MILVLLPGLDGTGELFQPFLSFYPDKHTTRVIAYPDDQFLSYRQLEAHVRAQLPEKEDFILLAESFSGPVAAKIAQSPPSKLKAVIFVASFISNPRPVMLRLAFILPLSLILKVPLPDRIIELFCMHRATSKQTKQLLRSVLARVPAKLLAFRLRQIVRFKSTLKQLSIPVSYLRAENDRLVSYRSAENLRMLCLNFDIVNVPGPHFILQSNPKTCARVVSNRVNQRFLKSTEQEQ